MKPHLEPLIVAALCTSLAALGCEDKELSALRERVTALETIPSTAAHKMEKHAHPRLWVSNLGGCTAPESKRVLVEATGAGNCSIDFVRLQQTPGPGGPGPCPANFDVVVRWWGMEGGPSQDTRMPLREQSVTDGGVTVLAPPFACPSPSQIREVWIVPAGFVID